MGRITFFYHASAESNPANRRDFFNTHACLQQLTTQPFEFRYKLSA
jgi:hypothetical protein